MSKRTVFIAGGGTGGHIYPGIAIARSLLQQDPHLEVRFVGTATGLESKIIPREGFALHLIRGGKLNFSGGSWTKIKTLLNLPLGMLQSIGLLVRYRPAFVLGVGGYASGPFVLIAALLGCRTGIWEPNAHPGMANRWLARFVDCCYVVFAQTGKALRAKEILQFGMPVRAEIETGVGPRESDHVFRILSFGGSQGSVLISKTLAEAIVQSPDLATDLQIVQQVPASQVEVIKKIYAERPEIAVSVLDYIYDMPKYYATADLVVARGGASTIMELAAYGVVPIIVPLPAADDHQQRNAESVVAAGGGLMILQKDLTVAALAESIRKLRADREELRNMSSRLKTLFKPKAAAQIARDILLRMGASL